MDRRTVLAGVGIAVAGLAGCAGETDRDGGTGTVTLTGRSTESTPAETGPQRLATGESTTFADGTSLTTVDPTVQESIVAYSREFLTIQREDGIQFVVGGVEGNADFEPSSFMLERNGRIRSPPQTQQYVRGVTRECNATCIAIPVDVGVAESAAIAYRSDGEVRAVWELDSATVTAFSDVPDLRLRDATVTDGTGDVGVEFSVDNVGERNGVFLALVAPAWLADAGEPVGFPVPRNETVTETVVPGGVQQLDPDEAELSVEPTADTRYFEIESKS
jgi:hypothetical protein